MRNQIACIHYSLLENLCLPGVELLGVVLKLFELPIAFLLPVFQPAQALLKLTEQIEYLLRIGRLGDIGRVMAAYRLTCWLS